MEIGCHHCALPPPDQEAITRHRFGVGVVARDRLLAQGQGLGVILPGLQTAIISGVAMPFVTLTTATIVRRRGTRDGDRAPSGDEHGNG
jgi:hypothetical protein